MHAVRAEWGIYRPRVDQIDEAVTTISDVGAQLRGTETVLLVEDEASVRALNPPSCEPPPTRLRGRQRRRSAPTLKGAPPPDRPSAGDRRRHAATGRKGACPAAQRRAAEINVLFMSGYLGDVLGDSDTHARGHFLPKPFPPRVLLQRVREILDIAA